MIEKMSSLKDKLKAQKEEEQKNYEKAKTTVKKARSKRVKRGRRVKKTSKK